MAPFTPAELAPGAAHVRYWLTAACSDVALAEADAVLSDEERSRRDAFRFERDRREYTAAHALLRRTLSEFGGLAPTAWRFEAGAFGKPALADGVSARPLSFSLAHTLGLVACIVAEHADVGIDVERVTRPTDWRAIALRYFAPEEVAQIDAETDENRPGCFFDFWTLKEAFVKATGAGLSQPLNAMRFDLDRRGVIEFYTPGIGIDPGAWQFALATPTPEHRLGVAVSDGSRRRWQIELRVVTSPDP